MTFLPAFIEVSVIAFILVAFVSGLMGMVALLSKMEDSADQAVAESSATTLRNADESHPDRTARNDQKN